MYVVYVLQGKNGRHYIGYTSDLKDRLRRHNSGMNRSTRPYRPWKIVYTEEYQDKKSAWFREKEIKSYKGGEALKRLLESGGVA